MAFFCILFYVLACLLFYVKCSLFIFCIILPLLTTFFFVLGTTKGKKLSFIIIPLLALSVAVIFTYANQKITDKYEAEYEGAHHISAKVTETLYSTDFGSEYIIKTSEIDGTAKSLTLHLKSNLVIEEGDTVLGEISICPLTENGSLYDESTVYGMGARLSCADISLNYNGKSNNTFINTLCRWNKTLSARLTVILGKENGGIAASLLLGNRKYLTDSFVYATKKLGLTHLIALSGMHLSVICAILNVMLSKAGAIAKRIAIIPIVIFYTALTGFSASLLRAALMLCAMTLISLTGRKTDQPTDLGMTLFLICVFSPYSVCDVGLQLSAAAMLGVFASLYLTGDKFYWLKNEKTAGRRIVELSAPFIMTVCAIIFTSPITALYYGSIAPMSILATVPLSLLVTVILWTSPFVLLFNKVVVIGDILRFVCGGSCFLYKEITEYVGKKYGFLITVDTGKAIAVLIAITLLFSLALVCDNKKLKITFYSLTALLLSVSIALYSVSAYKLYEKNKLTAIETGSGDGIVISQRDCRIAIDVSRGSKGMYFDIISASEGNLDGLIIADAHYAHANNINYLLSYVNVDTVYMPDTEDSAKILPTLREKGLNVKLYSFGDELKFEYFTVSTYEDTYISRSVVPITRFFIDTDNIDLYYYGSAAFETELTIEEKENCYVWLGSYGPKYKKEISFSSFEKVIISRKAAEFCNENTDFSSDAIKIPEELQKN